MIMNIMKRMRGGRESRWESGRVRGWENRCARIVGEGEFGKVGGRVAG